MTKAKSAFPQFMILAATLALMSACSPPRPAKKDPAAPTPTAPVADNQKVGEQESAPNATGTTAETDTGTPSTEASTVADDTIKTGPAAETAPTAETTPTAAPACNDFSGEVVDNQGVPLIEVVQHQDCQTFTLTDLMGGPFKGEYILDAPATPMAGSPYAIGMSRKDDSQVSIDVYDQSTQTLSYSFVGKIDDSGKAVYTHETAASPAAPAGEVSAPTTASAGSSCAPFLGTFQEEGRQDGKSSSFTIRSNDCEQIDMDMTIGEKKLEGHYNTMVSKKCSSGSICRLATLQSNTLVLFYGVKAGLISEKQVYTANSDGTITREVFSKNGNGRFEPVSTPTTLKPVQK